MVVATQSNQVLFLFGVIRRGLVFENNQAMPVWDKLNRETFSRLVLLRVKLFLKGYVMKRLVVLLMVLVLCCGAWGQDQQQIQQLKTNQNQQVEITAQGPGSSLVKSNPVSSSSSTATANPVSSSNATLTSNPESSAGASAGSISSLVLNSTSIADYPEPKVGAVFPGNAPLVWPFPTQPWFWNSWPNNISVVYQREWTLDEVEKPLKKISRGPIEVIGSLFGKGPSCMRGGKMKWEVSLNDYSPRPKDKTTFTTIVQMPNMEIIQRSYQWIGAINLTSEGRTIDQAIRGTIRLAFDLDLDLGALTMGMNPVNSSMGISPGVGFNNAGTSNNFSLINSVSGGEAKVEGEPGVIMYVFRKNGAPHPLPKNVQDALGKVIEAEEQEGSPEGTPNQEMLKKAEKELFEGILEGIDSSEAKKTEERTTSKLEPSAIQQMLRKAK